MSFLDFAGKTFVIAGVANKKSVAYAAGKLLEEQGAKLVYFVHTEARKKELEGRLGGPIIVCDVEQEGAIARAVEEVEGPVHGLLHSIAFANYAEGPKPFHQVSRKDFLQSMQISCHSLIEMTQAFAPRFARNASVVTVSISTTTMAAENYGYMAPVKAALDSSIAFLANSFREQNVRFNAVCPGLLKTNSSAGIPGYVSSYLYAERVIPRKRGVDTAEVANTIAFLLSERSSGINAQRVVVDAGMSINYFDRSIIQSALRE
jgi:enoyl-[acyl-carrier protein] reductase I